LHQSPTEASPTTTSDARRKTTTTVEEEEQAERIRNWMRPCRVLRFLHDLRFRGSRTRPAPPS